MDFEIASNFLPITNDEQNYRGNRCKNFKDFTYYTRRRWMMAINMIMVG